jgi:hypothetical protein
MSLNIEHRNDLPPELWYCCHINSKDALQSQVLIPDVGACSDVSEQTQQRSVTGKLSMIKSWIYLRIVQFHHHFRKTKKYLLSFLIHTCFSISPKQIGWCGRRVLFFWQAVSFYGVCRLPSLDLRKVLLSPWHLVSIMCYFTWWLDA